MHGIFGQYGFCTPETVWLVEYDEVTLRSTDYIFVRPHSVWAEPSVDNAAQQLRAAYDNPAERQARAEAAYALVHKDFSVGAISNRYGDRLRKILQGLG